MSRPGDRIRVLHLGTHYTGNYRLFTDLVSGLDPDRYESIVCYSDRRSDEKPVLETMGFPVFYLRETEKQGRSSFSVTGIRDLRRFLGEHPVDLIHAQKYSAAITAGAASLGRGRIPLLLTVHSRLRFRRIRRKLMGMWLGRRFSRVVAVSDAVRGDVLATSWGIPAEKIVTVRNGIDPGPFLNFREGRHEARKALGLPEASFLVGTAGRLDPTKAHRDLIEAFHRFAAGKADAFLVIAGEGRIRAEIEEQIASLGLGERVRLLGYCRQIPRLMHALDVFALSSLREGLPLVVLEAMASARPIVSTRAGGVPEALEGLEGGILVEPGDVPGIARGLDAMYELSAAERDRRGEISRARVLGRFTREHMVRNMERVYEDVLRERGNR